MNKIMRVGFAIILSSILLVGCCPLDKDKAIVRYHEDEIDDWDSHPNVELLSEIIYPDLKNSKAEKIGIVMKDEILAIIEYLHNEYNINNAYCDDAKIFYDGEHYIPVVEFGFSLMANDREELSLKIQKELPILADTIFNSVDYSYQIICFKVKVNGRVHECQINYEDNKIHLV